jgi:hypothetical protein
MQVDTLQPGEVFGIWFDATLERKYLPEITAPCNLKGLQEAQAVLIISKPVPGQREYMYKPRAEVQV